MVFELDGHVREGGIVVEAKLIRWISAVVGVKQGQMLTSLASVESVYL